MGGLVLGLVLGRALALPLWALALLSGGVEIRRAPLPAPPAISATGDGQVALDGASLE